MNADPHAVDYEAATTIEELQGMVEQVEEQIKTYYPNIAEHIDGTGLGKPIDQFTRVWMETDVIRVVVLDYRPTLEMMEHQFHSLQHRFPARYIAAKVNQMGDIMELNRVMNMTFSTTQPWKKQVFKWASWC